MLAALFAILFLCHAASIRKEEVETSSDPNSLVVDGDIKVTPEEYEELLRRASDGSTLREKRQMVNGRLWPNNTVAYSFSSEILTSRRVLVRKAMAEISKRSCITFREDDEAPDRVNIVYENGCWSSVGWKGGVQQLSIGSCSRLGNFVHELFHTLGVVHTASRSDRDEFLKINTSLFTSSDRVNFAYYSTERSYNVVPFEYGSVMMYSARAVSWPRDESFLPSMGVRVSAFYDYKGIHEKYQCSCPTEIECRHGGYMNTQTCDKCVCPVGYGGRQCETAPEEFSKKLTATSEWQTHSIRFGFTGFSEKIFTKATLFIEAPADKRIQVEVTQLEGFDCSSYCYWNGFEVKHLGDPRRINQLSCCEPDEGYNYNYTSKLNPTPVMLYSLDGQVTFGMRYRYINESISVLPTTNNTYDSFRYPV